MYYSIFYCPESKLSQLDFVKDYNVLVTKLRANGHQRDANKGKNNTNIRYAKHCFRTMILVTMQSNVNKTSQKLPSKSPSDFIRNRDYILLT